jgi:biotin operon repressor
MGEGYRPWLSRELDYLAAHAGRVGVDVLARHLGRSRASVARAVRRFRDLGLPDEQGGDDGCRGR